MEYNAYKAAYDEWQEKTEWVQQTATYDELGMHRADVLRKRIEQLEEMNEYLDEACARLEDKNESLKQEINNLEQQCYNLESDVRDAYRQLNYYED